MSEQHERRLFWPRNIRRFAVPIILFWVALAAVTNSLVPQLEVVAEAHNVGMSSRTRRRIKRRSASEKCSNSTTPTARR